MKDAAESGNWGILHATSRAPSCCHIGTLGWTDCHAARTGPSRRSARQHRSLHFARCFPLSPRRHRSANGRRRLRRHHQRRRCHPDLHQWHHRSPHHCRRLPRRQYLPVEHHRIRIGHGRMGIHPRRTAGRNLRLPGSGRWRRRRSGWLLRLPLYHQRQRSCRLARYVLAHVDQCPGDRASI